MASGDTLIAFTPRSGFGPAWAYVAFTSGSVAPVAGDTIWGDTSNENGFLEYISLESGTWAGGDAAGYMLLSNLTGAVADWTSGENFTKNTTTAANDGTLTALPVLCGATPDTRNNTDSLDFDDTVNEVAMFQGFIPRHYAGGGLTATISVRATTATTLDMSWKLFLKSITSDLDDIDTKVFATPQENTAVNSPSASGETIDLAITFTTGAQMDNIAAGEVFYAVLMRDAQDATNDDMSGDAEFVNMEFKET